MSTNQISKIHGDGKHAVPLIGSALIRIFSTASPPSQSGSTNASKASFERMNSFVAGCADWSELITVTSIEVVLKLPLAGPLLVVYVNRQHEPH